MLPLSTVQTITNALGHYKDVTFDSVVVFDSEIRLIGSLNLASGEELPHSLIQDLHQKIPITKNSVVELVCTTSQHGDYRVIVNCAHGYVILYLNHIMDP